MRFMSREMEVGLNILQLLYANVVEKPYLSMPEIAETLRENEPFTHKVLRALKEKGYVRSYLGPSGGYSFEPGIERKTLKPS